MTLSPSTEGTPAIFAGCHSATIIRTPINENRPQPHRQSQRTGPSPLRQLDTPTLIRRPNPHRPAASSVPRTPRFRALAFLGRRPPNAHAALHSRRPRKIAERPKSCPTGLCVPAMPVIPIPLALRPASAGRTSVHPAPRSAVNRRRPARPPTARPGAASAGFAQRLRLGTSVYWVIGHFCCSPSLFSWFTIPITPWLPGCRCTWRTSWTKTDKCSSAYTRHSCVYKSAIERPTVAKD
jgi:hypothetical protein